LDPCLVHANGGCSMHATCSTGDEGERVCMC
jgi:hypothetical protein